MSSTTLSAIIARLPEERATIERIGGFLEESHDEDAYTVDELYDRVGARSVRTLTHILVEMLNFDIVDSFMTVQSPSGAGLGEYHSFGEIPREIPDPYAGGVVRVSPSDVRVYYRRHRGK